MKHILIDAPLDPGTLERLRARPEVRIEIADPISDTARVLPPALLRSRQILFCSVPPANFDEMHSIEWIQLCSAGFEQLLPLKLATRGPLIREAALLRALNEGWIAGAALDTHFAYPLPPEHPLWTMPNVILTPHIAGSALSPKFVPRTSDLFEQNVMRFLEGRELLNELGRDQLGESPA